MELSGRKREPKGQALVEFALILLVLLGFIFIIIESGRLFQGWLTVQNSARSAGRYALTGQFDPTCLDTFPPCLDPRVESIKKESRKAAAGLAIFADVTVGDPNSFITEVWSQDRETGTWRPDDAGEAGEAVRIRVTYHLPIVVPLFEPIVDTVRLRGQVVVNNEDFDQISDNDTYSAAPSIGSGGDYEELPIADVRITKNTINDEFLLGESIDYYIDVYNDGPFDAEGIIVTDDLPNLTGFTYTGYTLAPEDGFCTDPLSWAPGTPVTCQLRNLSNDPPLNHVQIIISAQTPYSLPGSDSETLDNNVMVESDQSVTIDPDLSNNQALKQVILRKPKADIGVSLVDTPDPTLANRPLNYIATVSNFGSDPTGTITATINIDSNIDDVSISFTDPDCAKNGSHIVVCTIPLGLAAGGIDQFAIDVTTPSTLVSDPMFLTSVATVDSDIIDNDLLNNSDTAITTVAGKLGDVYIEKASEFDRMALGDSTELRYFITVGERTGPDLDSASAITVTDTLPPGMTFISSVPSSYCNIDGGKVVCAIPPADIPADPGTLQFEIVVRPDETGTFDNFVRIDSNLEDATPQDNTATAQTIVGANDLAITKSASENIFIGEPFTYTLTVENLGPRDLHEGLVIRDTLPDGVTAIDTDGPDGPSNCSPNGGSEESIVAWCLDEFHDEDSPLVFEITAISSVDGEIVNTASVYPSSENEPDPSPSNNEDSLTSLVQRKVDLVLDISEAVDPVTAGGQVSYNLQVWNLGPSFATEVAIFDNLPSVLTFDPTNSSAGCSAVGQSVTCSLDMLPVGITETMTIVADIDSALEGGDTFQNTAVVSSFEVELMPENNSDTEFTSVSRAVDLQITKSDSPDPVAAGAVLEYTLEVENNGPSDASNVTVTDELPSVLRFDPINSNDNCQAVGQLVTCNGLNLATNEIQSFNVSAIVTSTLPAGTSIQNTAIVTSTEQENNPGDNSASEGSRRPNT
ncbi:MAG: hypothetical protein AMJ70_09190 [Dehalococcoidia bacterium SG8_51_3]|nr:MAG: hypothetical protein AMJ70_09190 [Dehalococcoidia bacterium SG8_51_3]